MLLPIILNIMDASSASALIHYLLLLYPCYKNKWPIITLQDFNHYMQKYPDRPEYASWVCERFSIELLNEEQIASVNHYWVPNTIFDELSNMPWTEAYMYLMANDYDPLEILLDTYITLIEQNSSENIEAIIVFSDCYQCIKTIAAKHNIAIITIEGGQIRPPTFRRMTGMLCKGHIFGENDGRRRYEQFLNTCKDIPALSHKELLALFLSDKSLIYLKYYNVLPKYEIGIGGTATISAPCVYIKTRYKDQYLIKDAQQHFNPDEILYRPHPGQAVNTNYGLINVDTSPITIQFILSCKRIALVSSGLAIDAMLWNRIVYSKTEIMPHGFICDKDIHSLETHDIRFLNWYLFSYLVPYEQIFRPGFITQRLAVEDESQLYIQGLSHYTWEIGLSLEELVNSPNRLVTILHARGLSEQDIEWLCTDEPYNRNLDNLYMVSFAYTKQEGQGSHYFVCKNVSNVDGTVVSQFVVSNTAKTVFFEPCQINGVSIRILDCISSCSEMKVTYEDPYIDSMKNNFFSSPPRYSISCPDNITEGTSIMITWVAQKVDELSFTRDAYNELDKAQSFLSAEYIKLESSHSNLYESYHELESAHAIQVEKYSELEVAHKGLISAYHELENAYAMLAKAYDELDTAHKGLISTYHNLESAYNINKRHR